MANLANFRCRARDRDFYSYLVDLGASYGNTFNLMATDKCQDVVCLHNVHVARGSCSQQRLHVANIYAGTQFFPTLPSMLAMLEPGTSGLDIQLAKTYWSCAILWPDGTVVLPETSHVQCQRQISEQVCDVLAIVPPDHQGSQSIKLIQRVLA